MTNPADPKPQESLAAPLEPRCPSCGSAKLWVFLHENRVGCDDCRASYYFLNITDFGQFFTAQPPSAMTEHGGKHKLHWVDGPHDEGLQIPDAEDIEPAAEPHTLTREQIVERAREHIKGKFNKTVGAYDAAVIRRQEPEIMADFAMSLSLPSTRPPNCHVCGQPMQTAWDCKNCGASTRPSGDGK